MRDQEKQVATNQGAEAKAKIERLEMAMLAQPQADCGVVHSFAPGLYIRQVTLKAGTLAIGHYQKTTHLNIMLSGRVTIVNDDESLVDLAAPLTYVAGPGRKCGYIHEDVVWLNVYSTEETDVDKLEAMFLDKSEVWQANKPLLTHERIEDRKDFEGALNDIGVDAGLVRSQSENASDLIPFPPGSYCVKTGPSIIEGKGLFATSDIAEGEAIAPARIGGMRTPAGRYTNHAKDPNAAMRGLDNGDIVLVALRNIGGCRGGLDGEEITIDYRRAFEVTTKRISS